MLKQADEMTDRMNLTGRTLFSISTETENQAKEVASAAEETSGNVATVAASTEQTSGQFALHITGTAGQSFAVQFSDEPQFQIAGIIDPSNYGGHGSDTSLRAKEASSGASFRVRP